MCKITRTPETCSCHRWSGFHKISVPSSVPTDCTDARRPVGGFSGTAQDGPGRASQARWEPGDRKRVYTRRQISQFSLKRYKTAYGWTSSVVVSIWGNDHGQLLEACSVPAQSIDEMCYTFATRLLWSVGAIKNREHAQMLHQMCVDWEESEHSRGATSPGAVYKHIELVDEICSFGMMLPARQNDLPWNGGFLIVELS